MWGTFGLVAFRVILGSFNALAKNKIFKILLPYLKLFSNQDRPHKSYFLLEFWNLKLKNTEMTEKTNILEIVVCTARGSEIWDSRVLVDMEHLWLHTVQGHFKGHLMHLQFSPKYDFHNAASFTLFFCHQIFYSSSLWQTIQTWLLEIYN